MLSSNSGWFISKNRPSHSNNRRQQSTPKQYVFSTRDDLLQFRPCSVLKATHQEVVILFYPKKLEEATSAVDFVEGIVAAAWSPGAEDSLHSWQHRLYFMQDSWNFALNVFNPIDPISPCPLLFLVGNNSNALAVVHLAETYSMPVVHGSKILDSSVNKTV